MCEQDAAPGGRSLAPGSGTNTSTSSQQASSGSTGWPGGRRTRALSASPNISQRPADALVGLGFKCEAWLDHSVNIFPGGDLPTKPASQAAARAWR